MTLRGCCAVPGTSNSAAVGVHITSLPFGGKAKGAQIEPVYTHMMRLYADTPNGCKTLISGLKEMNKTYSFLKGLAGAHSTGTCAKIRRLSLKNGVDVGL